MAKNNQPQFKQTEIGLIPEDWEILTIKDFCSVKNGKTNSIDAKSDGIYPLFDRSHEIKYSDKYLFDSEAIIIPGEGKEFTPLFYEGKFDLHQRAYAITPDSKNISMDYLYYWLDCKKDWLSQIAVGSTVKSLRLNMLKDFIVGVPSLNEQQKIAEVLGTLDEKIELNRKMNKTLESLGQAIFKRLFIYNNKHQNWQERKLGEFVELVNGSSYKSSELSDSDTALITLGNFVRGGGFKRDGFKEYTGKLKESQIIHDGDVLVAHTDITQRAEIAGVPALATGTKKYKTVGISMDIVKVNPLDINISPGLLYFLLKSVEFQGYKYGYVSGTTVLHLNKKCIPDFTIQMPVDTKELRKISDNFQPLIEKIAKNEDEIETLSQIRDSLLPRLMSGKLRVG